MFAVVSGAPPGVLAVAVLGAEVAIGACHDVIPPRARMLLNCTGLKKYIELAQTTTITKMAIKNLMAFLF
jgi:hypothetical protein